MRPKRPHFCSQALITRVFIIVCTILRDDMMKIVKKTKLSLT